MRLEPRNPEPLPESSLCCNSRAQVDFPTCVPHPIIFSKSEICLPASDWRSWSHTPVLDCRGSWESELLSSTSGLHIQRGGRVSKFRKGIPKTRRNKQDDSRCSSSLLQLPSTGAATQQVLRWWQLFPVQLPCSHSLPISEREFFCLDSCPWGFFAEAISL